LSHENNWLTNGLKGKRYGRHEFRRFPGIGGALSLHKIQIKGFLKCSASQILGPYRVSSNRRSSHIFLLLRFGNLYPQLASLIWVLQQICCWRIHDERSENFYSLGPNPNRGKGASCHQRGGLDASIPAVHGRSRVLGAGGWYACLHCCIEVVK
jgi:hypothetical protein